MNNRRQQLRGGNIKEQELSRQAGDSAVWNTALTATDLLGDAYRGGTLAIPAQARETGMSLRSKMNNTNVDRQEASQGGVHCTLSNAFGNVCSGGV